MIKPGTKRINVSSNIEENGYVESALGVREKASTYNLAQGSKIFKTDHMDR